MQERGWTDFVSSGGGCGSGYHAWGAAVGGSGAALGGRVAPGTSSSVWKPSLGEEGVAAGSETQSEGARHSNPPPAHACQPPWPPARGGSSSPVSSIIANHGGAGAGLPTSAATCFHRAPFGAASPSFLGSFFERGAGTFVPPPAKLPAPRAGAACLRSWDTQRGVDARRPQVRASGHETGGGYVWSGKMTDAFGHVTVTAATSLLTLAATAGAGAGAT